MGRRGDKLLSRVLIYCNFPNGAEPLDPDGPAELRRHFAVTIAVLVGNGLIALKAESIEQTQETGITWLELDGANIWDRRAGILRQKKELWAPPIASVLLSRRSTARPQGRFARSSSLSARASDSLPPSRRQHSGLSADDSGYAEPTQGVNGSQRSSHPFKRRRWLKMLLLSYRR